MILHGYILCWNEIKILPFVIDYWKNAGVDKLFVFDNGSTDGSLEYLSQFDWVEICHFSPLGDELLLTEIRNQAWKNSKGVADWVIIADCDEVPFADGNLKETLQRYEDEGYTAIRTLTPQPITETFPEYDGKLLHTREGLEFGYDPYMHKTHTFKVDKINEINFSLGMHTCRPYGEVKFLEFPEDYRFYHLRHLGKDYVVDRAIMYLKVIRPDLLAMGIDCHYAHYVNDYESEIKKLKAQKEPF